MSPIFFEKFQIESEKNKSIFDYADFLNVRVPTSCGRTGECHECIVELIEGFEGLSEKFSISDMTSGGCWPIGLIRKTTGNGPLDKSPCKEEYQRLRLEKVMGKKNSIIVIGARFPLYLSNRTFNNEEGGVETIDDTEIFSKFESVIPDLSLDEAFQKVVVELLE